MRVIEMIRSMFDDGVGLPKIYLVHGAVQDFLTDVVRTPPTICSLVTLVDRLTGKYLISSS